MHEDVRSSGAVRLAVAVLAGVTLLAAAGAAPATVTAGPTLSSRPTIRGGAMQGSRLTATPGTWHGSSAIHYAYQWYRCDTMGGHCRPLRGVTGTHHKIRANDVGHTLALDVRAKDSTGSTNGYASVLGPIAGTPAPVSSIVQPVVSGTAVLGGTIHVDTGKWSGVPKTFNYQWVRCNANGRACAPIAGDRSDSHTIVRRDVAHALVAIVQARSETDSRAVLSLASAPVAGTVPNAAQGPTATAPPVAAGVVQAGKQLAGSAGTWSGAGTIEYRYQWYRCDAAGAHCLSIHGATKPTYLQVVKDISHTLGFAVRASDANGTTSAYAGLVGPVARAAATLVSTAQPTLSGTPAPGQTLQATAGSWSETPVALSYQWQRCNANGRLCTEIAHATAAGYAVTAADAGHTLLAIVQATAGARSQSAFSIGLAVPA
jgi:hypothetical protein